MTYDYLIKGARIINENSTFEANVYISASRIARITDTISREESANHIIDGRNKILIPGIIDDQVHFREPGLTYKADLETESRAAVAGGITSYMEMPNTVPNTLTQELLQDKYDLASQKSYANYSFYMGVSNDNIEEVLRTNPSNVCGIKIFMGSSTGNMLVDDLNTLENIFAKSRSLIAVHCEDETTIQNNLKAAKEKYGEDVPWSEHANIRSDEACFKSSSLAVRLAKKHNSRLHVLHLSSKPEMDLFDSQLPLREKRITSEVCVHHLWFTSDDYIEKESFIKWNPSVKHSHDNESLWTALLDDRLDVIATDHAPHQKTEKLNSYFKAPSGGPLVQHSLVAMLDLYHQGKISLEKIVDKMCHAPAECFKIKDRGYIKEGFKADLVLVDLDKPWKVETDNILYKCGWSPFEGHEFKSSVCKTFVSGQLVYNEGSFSDQRPGERLLFNRGDQ